MARDIKKLEWHRYIPKWDNQHKDENSIELQIHPLSQVELSKYGRIGESLKKTNEDNYANELSKKMFVDNVKDIKNLKCNGIEIKDSLSLWELGIASLNNEITEAILDISKLQEDEKKD